MFAFIDLSSHYFWQWLSLFIDAGFLWYLKLGLLLLLLSRFSRAWLCVTPETAAHQAPPSLGFSRQEPLEWVAISFSNAWKWKVKVKSLSRVRLFATPWTVAYQAPPPTGFSRQEYWSGLPLPLFHLYLKIILVFKFRWISAPAFVGENRISYFFLSSICLDIHLLLHQQTLWTQMLGTELNIIADMRVNMYTIISW